jgi:FMN phosphatase YigB (HAD superfamily)
MISLFAKDLKINRNILLKEWIRLKIKSQKKNLELEKIIRKLKKAGYKGGSSSGVIDLHYKIGKKNKLYRVFDFNLTSFKMGLTKPHKKMYRLLIKKLKLQPEEIVVIDDTFSCLDVAKNQGLNVILYKNNFQLMNSLKKLKIKLPI